MEPIFLCGAHMDLVDGIYITEMVTRRWISSWSLTNIYQQMWTVSLFMADVKYDVLYVPHLLLFMRLYM